MGKMVKGKNLPVLHVDQKYLLPDGPQWVNRFQIKSSSSNRLYVISQHKTKRHWGCSCPAWLIRRKCKHLQVLQLPCHEQPHEIKIETS